MTPKGWVTYSSCSRSPAKSVRSPSSLTVSVQSGSEDCCLQTVIPQVTISQNPGKKVSCHAGGQENHLGALKAKSSRTHRELGKRSVCSPIWWDRMFWGQQPRERDLCRMPGGCCSAKGRLRDVTTSREHCCLHWVILFRRSSCSSF